MNSSVQSMVATRRIRRKSWLSNLLLTMGVLSLAAAAVYGAFAWLNNWLLSQNRYLLANEIAPLSMPAMTWTPSPLPTATTSPTVTPTPTPLPSPTPPPAPVQIQIPALRITRSIVKLPRIRDRSTGAWTWNTKSLFRPGRPDLVGHWQGSANPGENGNIVLVGHNYGYGYNGVFVRLGSLKAGQKVYLVNQAGQTFTYQVTTVKRLKWRRKSLGELTQHLAFLAPGGPERVTLVSCAGADFEPFPERVYVVALPVK